MDRTGYLAPEGLEEALHRELKHVIARYGRLFLAEGPVQNVHWVQNIWINPQTIPFHSIKDAARLLRSFHGLWAYYPNTSIRRGELIAQSLPYFSPKPLSFPSPLPTAPLGSWTLLDENTLLCSPQCSSPFAHGEVKFLETKEPPSRAYLKLWEFFTRVGKWPREKDQCLELGASPGSWTWVLQRLGAELLAVDRAPLDPNIAKLAGVSFLKKDAFSLSPEDLPDVKWIFSDLICYPDKLFEWIQPWLKKDVHLVCTLKFQGSGDYDAIEKFEQIEGSSIHRLFHNKHELTWCRLLQNGCKTVVDIF
jgi:23S rRNA (cytidine2498-2'-O)-methyltransferase